MFATIFLMFPCMAFAQEPPVQSPPLAVTLFFEENGDLKGETASLPSGTFVEDNVKAVFDRLAEGSQTLGAVLPKTAKLETVLIGEDKTVYLSFNEAFLADFPGGITQEILTASAICQTVFANFDFPAMQLLVKGKELKTLAGHVDVESPINRAQCGTLAKYKRE
ncbi:MAG: GerMN domain-containing protein [Nitrospinae bacterium]|nr:GerMN domain-containing protein [Nitrospinota bacterium]